MASACVNNSPVIPSSFALFTPNPKPNPISNPPTDPSPSDPTRSDPVPDRDASAKDLFDFEFTLHDPVGMLTADELFSDGKLVPLHLTSASSHPPEGKLPDTVRSTAITEITATVNPSISSPRAPKCSSRWRELLGLKKLQQSPKPVGSSRNPNPNPSPRSIRNLLSRHPRSSSLSLEPSLSLPLLRDSDSDSLSLSSSRLSLSSTSSSSDSCDLARLSLDSDKTGQIPARSSLSKNGGPVRVARPRPARRAAADAESPRMNSSGKVVFYSGSLERSSSSPSSFNGGPRVRPRGMERSFSANVVRVNPVLNVPVCSLRGSAKSGSVFGFFGPKKEAKGSGKAAAATIKSERGSRE